MFDHPLINDAPFTTEARAATGGLLGLMPFWGLTVDSTIQCDMTAGASANTYGNNSYPWNAYDEALFSFIWDGCRIEPSCFGANLSI